MVIPTGFCQINFQFTGPAVPSGAEITLGVDNGTALSPTDVGAAALAAYQAADMNDQMVATCVLTNIHVKNGPNSSGPQGDTPAAEGGGLGGTSVPPNTGVLVRKNTSSGGRKGSGRLFVPGMDEADVSGSGDLSLVRQGAVQGFWDDFFTELNAADIGPVLLHADTGTAPFAITSFAVQIQTATQRRRLRR